MRREYSRDLRFGADRNHSRSQEPLADHSDRKLSDEE